MHISDGDCSTDCSKINVALLKLFVIYFCCTCIRTLTFYVFRNYAIIFKSSEKCVHHQQCIDFLHDVTCSGFKSASQNIFFIGLTTCVCAYLRWRCFMNIGTSYGFLLMSFCSTVIHLLIFYLIAIVAMCCKECNRRVISMQECQFLVDMTITHK